MRTQLDRLYRSIVWNLASKKINLWIKNPTQEHASIIVEALLAHAKNSIRIRTTDFDPAFYGSANVMTGLNNLLGNTNSQIEIICRKPQINTIKSHPWIQHMQSAGRVSVWQESTVTAQSGRDFILSDQEGLRLEHVDSNQKAEVNFGDEITVARTLTEFNQIKLQAAKIY